MLALLCLPLVLQAPAPVAYWEMRGDRLQAGQLQATKGPNLMVSGFPVAATVDGAPGLRLGKRGDELTYWWEDRSRWAQMPKRGFTVSVTFAPDKVKGSEGLLGCSFEPEEGLTGWRILLKDGKVEFTLASRPSKTTGGQVSVSDPVTLTPNHLHRVDASYDGNQVRLFVDGVAKGQATANLGDIVYNGRAGICFGGWWEGPRSFGYQGFYGRAALFDQALTPAEVDQSLAATPFTPPTGVEAAAQRVTIEPYFQYPTQTSATVMWETSNLGTSRVKVGESAEKAHWVEGVAGTMHRVELRDLKPETTYFVQVESNNLSGNYLSEWQSFRTAAKPGTPVKFAVVGDTQDNPDKNHRVAAGIFAAQPDFAMVVGDLVGCGWVKKQWTDDFFGSMRPLFSYVPLLPVMGNHDRNARLYYDLMAAPAPVYYYTYVTGDVQIWVIDTEHDVAPGSEQYQWLDKGLRESKAKWKIVAHHYPPYSSDLDDFGDSTKGPTEGGDLTARQLCPLYDKYGVDICFSGHIHSYERSQPIRAGKVAKTGHGTIYMVVGGGGGGTEEFAPNHSVLSHTVRTGHHYGIVWADSQHLEFRAYDIDQHLFDSFELRK